MDKGSNIHDNEIDKILSNISMFDQICRYSATIPILYHLSIEGSSSKSVLRKKLTVCQDAIENSLNILINKKLVTCEQLESFPFTKIINLSEKGHILVKSSIIDWPKILKE